MGIHKKNSSRITVVLGLTLTLLGYQNCTKTKFTIDDAVKEKTLSDGSVFDPSSGVDPSVPSATPSPTPAASPTPVTGGKDPSVPTPTPTPAPTATPVTTTGSNVNLVPNAVCGPKLMIGSSAQSTLPKIAFATAVLYKSSSFSSIGLNAEMVEAWDSPADGVAIRAQLGAMKPFSLKTKKPLLPNSNYLVVMYDTGKVMPPYPYNAMNTTNAVAPILDTIAKFMDFNASFSTDGNGKQKAAEEMKVLVGEFGDPLCDSAGMIDPLILQLKTDKPQAISLTGPEDGVMFDLLGRRADHKKVKASWFTNGDTENYFLVLPNKSGDVLGIDELFGDATLGPDMKYAKQGFAALAKYDDTGDQIISADDEVFSQLRLWKDKNLDGIVQADELYTLDEKGVVAIDLRYDKRFQEVDKHGNMTKYKSIVVMKDDSYGLVFDLYLRYLGQY